MPKKMIKVSVVAFYEGETVDLKDIPMGNGLWGEVFEDKFEIFEERLETDAEYLERLSWAWETQHQIKVRKLKKIVIDRTASDEQEIEYLALLKEREPEDLVAWDEEKSKNT